MPVYQNSGPGLGEALLRGAQGFMQVRANKKADEQFEADMADRLAARNLQRAQLGQQGIHLLDKGETLPTWLPKASANDISSRMAIPDAPELTFSPEGGAPTMQPKAGTGRAAAGAANIPNRPASMSGGGDLFQQTLAANLGGMPNRGPRYEVGQGYWLDKQPQWDAQDAASGMKMRDAFVPALVQQMVAAGERSRKVQQYVAAGVPADRAALYVDNPQLAENDPKVGRPTPRNVDPLSAEGIAAGATRAAAIAKAEAPYKKDPNAQTPHFAFVPGVDDNGNPVIYRGNNLTGGLDPTGVGAKQSGGGQGQSTMRQRAQALANVSNALDSFEKSLTTTGSTLAPGVAKDALQTDYENLELQLKEMYNLGVLNGHDLELMRRVVGDPTSVWGRAKAFGNGEEQTNRILGQIHALRGKLNGMKANLTAGGQPLPTTGAVAAPATPAKDPGGNINLGGDTALGAFSSLVPKGKKP